MDRLDAVHCGPLSQLPAVIIQFCVQTLEQLQLYNSAGQQKIVVVLIRALSISARPLRSFASCLWITNEAHGELRWTMTRTRSAGARF